MKYVQLSRDPGRVKIILSRVLAAGLAVAAVCLLIFFLRMEDFFFFGIVGAALIALLAAAAALCIYCVFQEKGMYFRCRWPEERLPAGREARLRELQRLYDQQLITKEDYDQKRQEILKEL